MWLLLAGIIAIGIAIGLFAANITVMLLSSFGVRAADPVEVSALPHPPTMSASVPGASSPRDQTELGDEAIDTAVHIMRTCFRTALFGTLAVVAPASVMLRRNR